jgi:hypothetical protein
MCVSRLSKCFIVVMSLVIAGLACDFPGATSDLEPAGQDHQSIVATRVAKTAAAGGVAVIPEEDAVVQPPTATSTLMLTPTITLTPTVTLTPTPSVPMVSVSVNTNCRYGPGMVYEYLGGLLVGETAVIHGRNQYGNFWYIENPDEPGGYCWISAAYAQVSGDTSQVPVLTPPPTPTYTPVPLDFNIDEPLSALCTDRYILYAITNTGPQPIESVSFYVEDLDTGQERSRSENMLATSPSCLAILMDAIPPGGEAFVMVGSYPYDPFGHNVRTTVKVCSEDGLGGSCVEKTFTDIVTGVSDAAQKENRDQVDEQAVLERLLAIPIETWNYIDDPHAIPHMGPMAQDFFAAYGLGVDDRLNAIDVQGVALAAIQALHEDVQEKETQLVELEARLSALEEHAAAEDPSTERIGLIVAGFLVGVVVTSASSVIWGRRRKKET